MLINLDKNQKTLGLENLWFGEGAIIHGRSDQEKRRERRPTYCAIQKRSVGFRNTSGSA